VRRDDYVERPFSHGRRGLSGKLRRSNQTHADGDPALDVVLAQHLSEGEQTNFRRLFRSTNRTIEVMNQNSILIPRLYSGPHSIVCRDVSRA
jgi:hypothetical protein